jgi:prepilin-type N-terminal cleavage/methylation domain-containing protein
MSFPPQVVLSAAKNPTGYTLAGALLDSSLALRMTNGDAMLRRRRRSCAFTLIELIFVMALLAISALMVTARMSSFFQGRALSHEARRLLALTHYGQSRAIAEGVPVLLWINARESTYGLTLQAGYVEEDHRASSFTVEAGLRLETPDTEPLLVSEADDEKLGLPEGLPVIRFLPDGFCDEVSVRKIVIRQGTDAALQLVPTANRLGYEILPATPN